jgi:hypothetical protein
MNRAISVAVAASGLLAGAAAAGPPRAPSVPRGTHPIVVPKPKGGVLTVPRGPAHRGGNGWYWHKSSKTWRHGGGTHPDTNYHEANKEREYLQLEDPEGVWERTHKR